jgi:hypothetical protein
VLAAKGIIPKAALLQSLSHSLRTNLKYKYRRFFTAQINVITYELIGKYRVGSVKWESPEAALIFLKAYYR